MADLPLVIQRKDDDPLALRASVGGRQGLGFYLTYRGDPQEVVEMLDYVAAKAREELVDGKPQG